MIDDTGRALGTRNATHRVEGADAALSQAATLGRTLVVVPHPDDETLGCGGLLALLARAGSQLMVVLMSDGAASHPNSQAFPAWRLQSLRMHEFMAALQVLGVASSDVWAMELSDGAIPSLDHPAFADCIERFSCKAGEFQPDTVVLPWRHDNHPDHRASHNIAWIACDRVAPRSRRLEYMVWSPAEQRPGDHGKAIPWHIAIDSVVERKNRALEAHRSQLGLIILDDPQGFVLPAGLVARCSLPTETFFDTTAWGDL